MRMTDYTLIFRILTSKKVTMSDIVRMLSAKTVTQLELLGRVRLYRERLTISIARDRSASSISVWCRALSQKWSESNGVPDH